MGRHVYSFETVVPQHKYPFGYRKDVRKTEFPALSGISLSHLHLEEEGLREPHWHPNAHELSLCLSGKALLTLFGPDNRYRSFQVSAGEIAFIPMGTLHSIQNVGNTPLGMLVAFNHENPEDLNLSSCISWLPPTVLGKTFNVSQSLFEKLPKTEKGFFITSGSAVRALTDRTDSYKFALRAKQPDLISNGGSVQISNQYFLPSLQGLALYYLTLKVKGIREPHWHPNAHELNYLINGSVKITLVSPEGVSETFEMKPGDISFMPKGYFHYIENLSGEPIEMAVFFTHEFPSDIGLSGALSAYSDETIAAIFNMDKGYFATLPKFSHDLMIVGGG